MRDFSKTVESRIWSYYDVLYGLRGFFLGSREVDRAEFRKYYETLNLPPRYPGFQALTLVRYVRGGERAAFERRLWQETSAVRSAILNTRWTSMASATGSASAAIRCSAPTAHSAVTAEPART